MNRYLVSKQSLTAHPCLCNCFLYSIHYFPAKPIVLMPPHMTRNRHLPAVSHIQLYPLKCHDMLISCKYYCCAVLAELLPLHLSKFACFVHNQRKCEPYWNEKLQDPFDAGRNITVTTTGHRTLADYEVRDFTVQCVSSSPCNRCMLLCFNRFKYHSAEIVH